MSIIRILRANRDLALLLAGALLVLSFAATRTYALYENRLSVHPEWESTKTTLGRGVMGAIAFVAGQQALARNRLNLGAWFGFQEVLHREELDLASLRFRFRNEEGGYVHVLFDHRPDGFSGVRFSSYRDLPGTIYRATPDGEFTSVDTVIVEPVTPRTWHDARLSFAGDSVVVSMNGTILGVLPRVPGPQRVGFRGGLRSGWVDDVVMTSTQGRSHCERFVNTRQQWTRLAAVCAGLLLLATAALTAAVRLSATEPRMVMLGMVTGVVVATAAVAGAYALQYVRAADYDVPTGRYNRPGRYFTDPDVVGGIRRRYSPDVPANTYRLLALGSSQVWGAGARSEEETWIRQLEVLLNQSTGGRRVEIVNAGKSGLNAGHVHGVLSNDLDWLAASGALVNLSNNDVDPTAFRTNLTAIAAELAARGVDAVFLLEANSPERRVADTEHGDLAVKHAIMRSVAAAHGFPVIDLHGYLAMHQDAGFLWWDFVHPASFGQRLAAQMLARELPSLLGIHAAY
jgi:hypothetical protein